MDIFEKIDQIREKPEHIRRLYVWFFVAIFMLLIIGIWFISLKSSLNSSKGLNQEDKLQVVGETRNENSQGLEIPSLDSTLNDTKGLVQ